MTSGSARSSDTSRATMGGYGARDHCPACPVRPTHFTRLVADAGEPVGQRTGDSKRWLAHIFHASPCPPPVPKWRNDAIPRTHGSRRAPESHAPTTFFLPADALRTEAGPPKASIAHPRGSSPAPASTSPSCTSLAPGKSRMQSAQAPRASCASPPLGGVLVMSSGLALRQVGSRESSASGFRRAGLAWREVGWIVLRRVRMARAGLSACRPRPGRIREIVT